MITLIEICAKNLFKNRLTTSLNILLVAFGVSILSVLLLGSMQISNKLEENSRDIDLVVGAKGSPLQLILSSIYHIDFPTGNIPLAEAEKVMKNPLVKRAVPLALGDNYNGFRIVGTDSSFTALYGLHINSGNFWAKDLQVTLGSTVAAETGLKIGDTFFGAHGLSGAEDIHKQHAYIVKGILTAKNNVTDNLILTNIGSVYKMHEETHDEHVHHPEKTENKEITDKEITALLIQYRSPMSTIIFPRMINKNTGMQAASPALESARLFSLVGIGIDTLKWFAVLIMAISAFSIFVSLYNSMKERKYDLALMRCLGASKIKLFVMVLLEGMLLTFIGALVGLLIGHCMLCIIGYYQDSAQARITGFYFDVRELFLLLTGIGIGMLSSVLPAFQSYRVDIAKILSKDN